MKRKCRDGNGDSSLISKKRNKTPVKKVSTPKTNERKIAEWLKLGLSSLPKTKADVESDFQTLHYRDIGDHWSLKVLKNRKSSEWYIDIRKQYSKDPWGKGACFPVRMFPYINAAMQEVPSFLAENAYEF